MSLLEVPGESAQGLEEPSLANEEDEKLLASKSILAVGVSLLQSKAEVMKHLMEDYLDEIEDLEVLEDLGTTCYLEEATLCLALDEREGRCLL